MTDKEREELVRRLTKAKESAERQFALSATVSWTGESAAFLVGVLQDSLNALSARPEGEGGETCGKLNNGIPCTAALTGGADMVGARAQWCSDLGKRGEPFPGERGLAGFAAGWEAAASRRAAEGRWTQPPTKAWNLANQWKHRADDAGQLSREILKAAMAEAQGAPAGGR